MIRRALRPIARLDEIHPKLSRFWAGEVISVVGTKLTELALPLLALKELGASPAHLGGLWAAAVLADLAFGVRLGALADRMRALPLLRIANGLRFVVLGSVALAMWAGVRSILLIYLAVTVTSVLEIVATSSLQALVARLDITSADRAFTNAMLSSTLAVGRIIGSSLAGVIVFALGFVTALALDAVTFVVVFAVLFTVSEPPLSESVESEGESDIRRAWLAITRAPGQKSIVLASVHYNLFVAAIFSLLPATIALASDRPELVLGAMGASWGIGGLIGSALAARVELTRIHQLLSIAFGAPGILSLAYILPDGASIGRLALTLVAHGVIGGLLYFNVILSNTFRQLALPANAQGSSSALVRVTSTAAEPIGSVGFGLAAAAAFPGLRLTVFICAIGQSLSCLWLQNRSARRHMSETMRSADEPRGEVQLR